MEPVRELESQRRKRSRGEPWKEGAEERVGFVANGHEGVSWSRLVGTSVSKEEEDGRGGGGGRPRTGSPKTLSRSACHFNGQRLAYRSAVVRHPPTTQ